MACVENMPENTELTTTLNAAAGARPRSKGGKEMQPVTLWSRQNQRGVFEFNHLDDGHVCADQPPPKPPNHINGWAGGRWAFEHAWIDAGRVLRLPNV